MEALARPRSFQCGIPNLKAFPPFFFVELEGGEEVSCFQSNPSACAFRNSVTYLWQHLTASSFSWPDIPCLFGLVILLTEGDPLAMRLQRGGVATFIDPVLLLCL